jgi:pSer/pThr/pTyr-binding forkhead associated (FHA) protein
MDDYIEVRIDVFEHTSQRARLRRSLTAGALVDEILKEFDDVSADSPGKYALYLKGADRPLNASFTIEQLDIQPQDELVFNYVRQTIRQMLDSRNYAFLKDDSVGRVYDIQWQPAIIGRPTNEADHNINLAVNLQLHPKGQTVSRKHAQITFSDGRFIIEPLAGNNPVYINGKEVPFGVGKEIKNGDRIVVGRSDLLMTFATQSQIPVISRESRPRPMNQVIIPGSPGFQMQSPRPEYSQPVTPETEQDKTYIAPNVPAATARLVVERATDMSKVGQRLDLASFPTLIGRDLPLLGGESEISRRHAEINFDRNSKKYFLTDTNSTNGVTLQGARIEANRPYEIIAGMRIGLGQNFIMRFDA